MKSQKVRNLFVSSLPSTRLTQGTDFEIPCWIKIGAAGINKEILTHSTDTFKMLRSKVAAKIRVLESSLDLAYTLSFLKATDPDPKALEEASDWTRLIQVARNYRSKPTTKRNNLQDSWKVQLIQTHELVMKNQSKVGDDGLDSMKLAYHFSRPRRLCLGQQCGQPYLFQATKIQLTTLCKTLSGKNWLSSLVELVAPLMAGLSVSFRTAMLSLLCANMDYHLIIYV